jgi:hypothetical protein
LDQEEWESEGVYLYKAANLGMTRWEIADWIIRGRQTFGNEAANSAALKIGFTSGTLRNLVSVAARVPMSLRNDKLTWNHHKEIAALEPSAQRQWLDTAAEKGLSARELRREIKGGVGKPKTGVATLQDIAPKVGEVLFAVGTGYVDRLHNDDQIHRPALFQVVKIHRVNMSCRSLFNNKEYGFNFHTFEGVGTDLYARNYQILRRATKEDRKIITTHTLVEKYCGGTLSLKSEKG